MTSRPSVDIVIVNWNSGQYLGSCVESIASAQKQAFQLQRVVIVDNASIDGSAECLDSPTLPLCIVRNDTNLGFGTGANRGIGTVVADYILVLNPDVRLRPDALDAVVSYLEAPAQGDVAIVGLQLLDDTGLVQRTCAHAPRPGAILSQVLGLDRVLPWLFRAHFMREWDHRETRDVDQVMGACMLMRGGTFAELGGFDERFFMYFEDVDLCLRARQAGARVVYCAAASAVHAGGGSTRAIPGRRLFYNLHSRLRFAEKHFGPAGVAVVYLVSLVVEPGVRLVRAAFRASGAEARQTVEGAGLLWASVLRMRSRSEA